MADQQTNKDASLGFAREEMFSKPLAGTSQPPSVHVFVAYGEYDKWEKRLEALEGSPISVLGGALSASTSPKKPKVGVTAIPVDKVNNEGDMLVFPDRIRIRGGIDHLDEVVAALTSFEHRETKLTALKGAEKLEPGAHIMVCSHTSRDARCGYCGPKIIDSVSQAAEKAGVPVTMYPCSHVGGHIYAGNVIIFRDDAAVTCDWLGYITDSENDASYVLDLCTSAQDHPDAKTWRGRMGLSKEEHIEMCQTCEACGESADIEDLNKSETAQVASKTLNPVAPTQRDGPASQIYTKNSLQKVLVGVSVATLALILFVRVSKRN
mmetsp:Transcript_10803/g.19071  ORF Transcript_10803/g.19071 Transcript_10803/m.19071 type:complete len:322 (-) Transcript_10803:25-990(-)